MCNAKVTVAKPTMTEVKREKSVKNILTKVFGTFIKRKEKKNNAKIEQNKVEIKNGPVSATPIEVLVGNFNKLNVKEEDEDELADFIVTTIIDEKKSYNSQSSNDSGFSDKNKDSSEDCTEKDVANALEGLTLEEKKKKTVTVAVPRGPIRNNSNLPPIHPYRLPQVPEQSLAYDCYGVYSPEELYDSPEPFVPNLVPDNQEINVVNPDILSGGYIITSPNITTEELLTEKTAENPAEYYLEQLLQDPSFNNDLLEFATNEIARTTQNSNLDDTTNIVEQILDSEFLDLASESAGLFPTPPRDGVSSPIISPNLHYSPDYHYPSALISPKSISDHLTSSPTDSRPDTAKAPHLKVFKDMQKDLARNYAEKVCCSKLDYKVAVAKRSEMLSADERFKCVGIVTNLDIKIAYGILHHILQNLPEDPKMRDMKIYQFCLICHKLVQQDPSLFTSERGLDLLSTTALCCPEYLELTQCVLQCIDAATRADESFASRACIFTKTDKDRNTLLFELIRCGDSHAMTLAAILDTPANRPPLFAVDHFNNDGRTPLQYAVSLHTPQSPRLLTVHALLHHGHADMRLGDKKGSDSAVHLAVNSATCDLKMVLTLFLYAPRDSWHDLTRLKHGECSITPIDYAKRALKANRRDYPELVLLFLTKCRQPQKSRNSSSAS